MIHGLETKFKTECKVNDSILAVYNFVILAWYRISNCWNS
jgi:hypothetical protein